MHKFFGKKHATCKVCRVHFEPYEAHEAFQDHCAQHRPEALLMELERIDFQDWCNLNRMRLTEQMKKERAAAAEERRKSNQEWLNGPAGQSAMNAVANAQSAPNSYVGGLQAMAAGGSCVGGPYSPF